MIKRHRTIGLLAILLLLAFAAAVAANDKWPLQLRFLSGPAGGTWHKLGIALADAWSAGDELPNIVALTGGGVTNITNVSNRRSDAGFTVSSLMGAALKGDGPFQGKKVENAVILTNLYKQYMYFVVSKAYADKHGIRSVGDIVAKKLPVRLATLRPGTASEFLLEAIFRLGHGIDYQEAIEEWGGSVEFVNYEGGADMLADNRVDCFGFSMGLSASIIQGIEEIMEIVILSVEKETIDTLAETYGTVSHTLVPGDYKYVTGPIPTVGDFTCIVVRRDLPNDLVYQMNKVLWEHRTYLGGQVKEVSDLTPANAIPQNLPAHPGSLEFWKGIR